MSSPLFNALNGIGSQNPVGNLSQFMTRFNNFRNTLGSNPEAQARQRVQEMLNSGQISQEQFNQASQLATLIQKMTGI